MLSQDEDGAFGELHLDSSRLAVGMELTRRGVVEVTELTRGGAPVRTARFMASRVLALVEHPADTSGAG